MKVQIRRELVKYNILLVKHLDPARVRWSHSSTERSWIPLLNEQTDAFPIPSMLRIHQPHADVFFRTFCSLCHADSRFFLQCLARAIQAMGALPRLCNSVQWWMTSCRRIHHNSPFFFLLFVSITRELVLIRIHHALHSLPGSYSVKSLHFRKVVRLLQNMSGHLLPIRGHLSSMI